ncbi:MAG: lysophospholipid acyltransferase family protein [Bacteroidetes bacterium]|nr:lysophospholipid acyltransferase family protein [Bacteroidota bacterium]
MKEKNDKITQFLLTRDGYSTPGDTPRFLFDRLTFNTRIYFMSHYVGLCLLTRSAAMKGHYNTDYWVSSSQDVFNLIEGCGGRFQINGLENIRNSKGPVVFISNHMSTLETMIFPGLIQPLKDVTFIVKDALVSHVIFGAVMRTRNPIVLSRSNPREDFRIVMEEGLKRISQGISVIVFPQHTRRTQFNPGEFNSIGVKLAAHAGVPVIPVAIKTDFWGNGRYTKYLGPIYRQKPIHIDFGKPITVTGPGKEEHQKVIEYIQSHLKQWKD